MNRYILNEHGEPVPEPNLERWAEWFQTADRRVDRTDLPNGGFISTVFLGLDHSFKESGPPVVWETMVFDSNRKSQFMDRCSGSREQAEAMHQRMWFHFQRKEEA